MRFCQQHNALERFGDKVKSGFQQVNVAIGVAFLLVFCFVGEGTELVVGDAPGTGFFPVTLCLFDAAQVACFAHTLLFAMVMVVVGRRGHGGESVQAFG